MRATFLKSLLLTALSLPLVVAGDAIERPFDFGAYKLVQFHVTYQDLGFVRRGLPGSVIRLLAPEPSDLMLYVLAACVALCLVLLYWLLVIPAFAKHGTVRSRILLYAIFLVAPATFWQVGYDLGRYDHLGTIVLLASLLLVERKLLVVAGLLGALAVLVHEAWVFMSFPVVLAAALTRVRPGKIGRPLMAVGLPVLVALVAVLLWGGYEPGREAFEAALARTGAPGEEFWARCVWTRGLVENMEIVALEIHEPGVLTGLVAALAWFSVFCLFYLRFHALNGLRLDALSLSPFLVIPLFAVGVDFERWLAAAALNMTIVMACKMRRRASGGIEGVEPSRSNLLPVLLLATAVLGPLGVARAFPLIDYLWSLSF
jgi:hypothetical protein